MSRDVIEAEADLLCRQVREYRTRLARAIEKYLNADLCGKTIASVLSQEQINTITQIVENFELENNGEELLSRLDTFSRRHGVDLLMEVLTEDQTEADILPLRTTQSPRAIH